MYFLDGIISFLTILKVTNKNRNFRKINKCLVNNKQISVILVLQISVISILNSNNKTPNQITTTIMIMKIMKVNFTLISANRFTIVIIKEIKSKIKVIYNLQFHNNNSINNNNKCDILSKITISNSICQINNKK